LDDLVSKLFVFGLIFEGFSCFLFDQISKKIFRDHFILTELNLGPKNDMVIERFWNVSRAIDVIHLKVYAQSKCTETIVAFYSRIPFMKFVRNVWRYQGCSRKWKNRQTMSKI